MKRYFPASTFGVGSVTEVPVSIPDIGPLQNLTINGGNFFDNWNIGGVIVRDANGAVKAGYCNCSLVGSNPVTFNLLPPDYYADYRIIIRTANRAGSTFDVDKSGTDSREYLTIIGDKGQTQKIDLGTIMTTQPGVFGLENLFEADSWNYGYITTKNIGTIQQIVINHEPLTAFEDKWDVSEIIIESYSNGNKNIAVVRDLFIDKRSSGFPRPVMLTNEKITTAQPVVNTPTQASTPVNNVNELANKTVRIQNYWKNTERINVETGQISSSAVADAALAAQWVLKPVPGTNFFWIENSSKPGQRINIETGTVVSSVVPDGAWSAHWILKKNSNGTYWIENRWKTGERLNIEKGKLECSKVPDGAWSAMWNVNTGIVAAGNTNTTATNKTPAQPPVTTTPATVPAVPPATSIRNSNVNDLANKTVRIYNFWKTTECIHAETGQLSSSVVADGALTAQWLLKPVPGTTFFWIENSSKAGHRINIETGTITSSPVQDGAWSAHWILKKNSNGTYWIENRWKTGERLNVENGKLSCSKIQDGAWSAMWNLK